MKKRGTTILLVFVLIIGLSLLLYPAFANYWNSFTQSTVISSYTDKLNEIDDDRYKELWEAAWAYNDSLMGRPNDYLLSEEQDALYRQLLDASGSGVMGYIEIPTINVELPIYHYTHEETLQVAIGHLEWTSLPVGGESSHCVVSGHRGLPSAKLFTNLDKLTVGDVFMLHVLDDVLTYQVDQILIVLPHETEELLIQEGKDLCTLVTCTPYGINSHRLFVRGHRIANIEEAPVIYVTADALQIEPLAVAGAVGIPLLFIAFLVYMLLPSEPGRKQRR